MLTPAGNLPQELATPPSPVRAASPLELAPGTENAATPLITRPTQPPESSGNARTTGQDSAQISYRGQSANASPAPAISNEQQASSRVSQLKANFSNNPGQALLAQGAVKPDPMVAILGNAPSNASMNSPVSQAIGS
jgi:hypothetical protein